MSREAFGIAESQFRRAVWLNPYEPDFQNHLAWCLYKEDKLRLLKRLGPAQVVAIGNGRNDVPMLRQAALGIAVLGPEGAAGDAVRAADILTRDIREALDLLLQPLRLKATYRK